MRKFLTTIGTGIINPSVTTLIKISETFRVNVIDSIGSNVVKY
jgi:hypothetical protein